MAIATPTFSIENDAIETVRRFNRFYTKQIGVLHEGLLESGFSLTETRILYELAHQTHLLTASEICNMLNLDAGYLSRILRKFEQDNLVSKETSSEDARQVMLRLTPKGIDIFAPLNERSRTEVSTLLNTLSTTEQQQLLHAMSIVQTLLSDTESNKTEKPGYILRGHKPGDMGWVTYRHGVIYAEEYGWDERFEGLVSKICADFIKNFDPTCEKCWIAEKDGEIVGSIFIVKQSEKVAQLRMLYVEANTRGLGIGKQLVQECVDFSKEKGYEKITLWTTSILTAARKLYQQAGFKLVNNEPITSFGDNLIGETWELDLLP